jgi:hypothetical protein
MSGFHARAGSAFANLPENLCGRITGYNGDGNDAAAGRFHFFSPNDLIARPVAALYEYIRKQTSDHLTGSHLVENDHSVYAFQRRKNFRTLAFRQDRTSCAFQCAHAGVAIEAHNQRISQRASLLEASHVPRMQQIKAAVGEDDAAAVAFLAAKPQNRFFECKNLRVQRNSMKAHANTALAFDENLVYHAQHVQRSSAGQLR